MSTRFNNGSHYENHQRATEIEKGPEHAHLVGETHGKQEHLSDHEISHAELAQHGNANGSAGTPTVGHGVAAFGHDDIAALAHELWIKRGSPEGSADEDWFHAVKELRTRAISSSVSEASSKRSTRDPAA